MSLDFEGKVALVTGASAGIGEATAVLLASRGARVALVGRNEAALKVVAAQCGPHALPIVADLSTDEGCELVAKKTLEVFQKLDVLVNNAAMSSRQTLLTSDMETFDQVFALNVRSVYLLTRLLVPALIQAKGNIVNVSSIAGSTAYLGSLPYSMSKAALNHFTDLIALELAPKGVRVNAVSPGFTETKLIKRTAGLTDAEYQAWLAKVEPTIPLGRVCSPRDIADTIAHLASPASRCTTATNVIIDGAARFSFGGSTNFIESQIKKQ